MSRERASVLRYGPPMRPAMESRASVSSTRANFDPRPAPSVRRLRPQGRCVVPACSDHRSGGCHRAWPVVYGALAGKGGGMVTPTGTCLTPGRRFSETPITHAAA